MGDGFRRASATVPALKLPHPEPAPLVILVDTREQDPWTFPAFIGRREARRPIVVREHGQKVGDYTSELLLGIATIERKSPTDFMQTITYDRERWDREVARFARYERAAIVVEGERGECAEVAAGVRWESVEGTIAGLDVRHGVPVHFKQGRMQAAWFAAAWLARAERVLLPRPTPLERLHGVALGLGL